MAKTLSNNGIVLNQIIYPQQVSQSIDALTGADDYDITISGSFTVTGSTSIDGDLTIEGAINMNGNVVAPNLTSTAQSNVVTYNSINGQFYYTSSNAISPATASNSVSASYAATASYVQNAQTASYVLNAVSASYAATASYVQNAQTASYVATASWAFNAVTASYVQNAQTASYVTLAQTASYVNQAVSASYATSASYAVSSSAADSAISASYSTTASFAQNTTSASYAVSASHADSSNTASYALTASYLEGYISPFPFTGSAQITGSLGVTGSATVNGDLVVNGTASFNVFHTIYNTSSIIFASGSTKFGDTLDDTHQFTGSLYVSGSVTADTFTGTASYATQAATASFVTLAQTASYVTLAQTASYVENAQTASYVAQAVSASYASTASYVENAQTASYVTLAQTASYVLNAVSASYATTSSYTLTVLSASYAVTASYALTALSASYAGTASLSDRTLQTDILAINQTGFTIEKGMVVRITGSNSSSDIPRITTASYETDDVSANTLGIATQQITNGSQGFVITEGVLLGIDTNNYISGQLIYLGANGAITGSAPQAPLHTVRLGQVIRQQSNNGSIHVRIDNGYELGELHDIHDTTTTASYGDLLVKSGSLWTNSNQLTGSYGLTGSLTATSFTGSLEGTASYAAQAATASFVTLAQTSSYVNQAVSASFASTASYVNQLNQTVNISGSLNTTGSVDIYKSGSTVLSVNGSTGQLISVTDSISGPLLTVATGSTNILVVDSSLVTTITGSLNVQNGVTASLFGTASWAQNAETASFVTTAQTASYVLNAVSASFASTASYVNQLNQTVNISGSLNATGSVNIYQSGSSPLVVSGSQGPLFEITDSVSGSLWTIYTGSSPIFDVSSDRTMTLSGSATITGSLDVQNGITGSLFGTASWAQNATTASYVENAQTASYVLNAVSASFASTASYVNQLNQTVNISGSLFATGSVDIYKSGSTVFAVSGSNGPLFDIADVVSGSLFTVWTGSNRVLQANSDYTTILGGASSAAALFTTTKNTVNSGSTTLYTLPTATYDSIHIDYNIRSGSVARAGNILAIWSGSSVNQTETSASSFGDTSGFTFGVIVSGSNLALTGSTSTSSWTVKTIIRSI